MKQFIWNLVKWMWVIVASCSYILYFTDKLSANLTMMWVGTTSIVLAASYGFLSGYRLGSSDALGEFIPNSEISKINYNQWLFAAWTVLSLGIVIPAYNYRPAWTIVATSLLVFGVVVAVAFTSWAGRHFHSVIHEGLMDF